MFFTRVVLVLAAAALALGVLADALFVVLAIRLGGLGIIHKPSGWLMMFGAGWALAFVIGWFVAVRAGFLPIR